MHSHTQELALPYAPEQMFELVSDIERYPEFVKWITALRISGARQEAGVDHCVGEAVVAFKGFTNTFATSVIADPERKFVEVGLVRGPFKHLLNTWRFAADGEHGGTRIFFHIEYEFSNFILQALARANHDYAIDKIVETFLVEAKKRYGAASSAAPA